MGFLPRVLSAIGIRNLLQSLSGANRLDASAIKNLSGGLSAWQLKTADYTAVAGDRLRVNAIAGDVIITLPALPSASDADIWIQRIDATSNKVLIRSGANNINAEVGKDGVFAPSVIQLIERISFINSTIGWLGQHDRLTYQAFVSDYYGSNVVFFVTFTGANNSTSFTDAKGNAISVRSGTPQISTAQSIGGNGSLILDGSSSLQVPVSASFAAGVNDFDIEMALYPTAFVADNQGLLDRRAAIGSTPDYLSIDNSAGSGRPAHSNGTNRIGLAALKLNQWQVLRSSRYQGVTTFYLDNIPIFSAADTVDYTSLGDLILFDTLNTASPNSGMFQGYCQYIRDTRLSRRQGYNRFNLAIEDTDPLESFKVIDINCDGSSIADIKGHSITVNGSAAASTAQNRGGTHSIALTGGNIDIAGDTDFNFGSAPYSVHLSARFTSVGTANTGNNPDTQYLLDFDAGDTSGLAYSASGGTPSWRVQNAAATANSFAETPATNTWYDMALAKVDTKYLLIKNNQIVAASNNAPSTANLSTLRIGGNRANATSNVSGFVDAIRTYKGIASGANLTHSYPLRFLARFSDSSPNDEIGAVGTIVGTAHTYDTANKRSLESSALFAGSGYISYPSISDYDLGSTGFELAGWIKPSTTPNATSCILSSGVASGLFDAQSWGIYDNFAGLTSISGKNTDNKLSFWAGAVSPSNAVLSSTTSINDGQPHYYRIIKYIIGASAVTILILDGKIEDVYIGAYTISNTTRGLIASNVLNTAGRNFKGNLDDLAIYRD